METSKNNAINKNIGNFRLVAFVTCSAEDKQTLQRGCTIANNSLGSLSGNEASDFYKEIISTPPSTSVPRLDLPKNQLHCEKSFRSSPNFNNRLTIFHYAQYGNLEGVKYCLSKKCNIDEQDMYGWTALMCATFEGHYSVVNYLIRCGADANLKNKQGQSACDIAMKSNNFELMELFKNGIEENMINNEDNVVEETKYCNLCNSSYAESSLVHKRSIAHLFNCKKEISTIYHIPENNKGFQIMLKKGWDKNKGLGMKCEGRKFPIKTIFKSDRSCIGGKKEIPRITHVVPSSSKCVQSCKFSTMKLIRERTLNKWEKEKLKRKERQKEINFRREFCDL